MSGPSDNAGEGPVPWAAPERGVLVLAVGQALSLGLAAALANAIETSFFWVHAVFFGWGTAVGLAFLSFLRAGRSGGGAGRSFFSSSPVLIVLVGIIGVVASLFGSNWGRGSALPADRPDLIRMAAMLSGVAAFLLFFAGRWAHSVERRSGSAVLRSAIHMTWAGIAVHLLGAAVLFFYLYSGIDGVCWTGRAAACFTLALVADGVVGLFAEFYQPEARRGLGPPGRSALLDWTLVRANPAKRIAVAIESTYGIKLGDIWAVRFMAAIAGPLALLGLFMGWASTCLTVVPAESEGVRIRMGRFQAEPLPPGPHVGWPWPFESIVIVPTRRIEEVHVGYDEDLGGPVLWNERHYVGEKNMLAGSGEELLTVSVLIHYRIADPVAHLLHARGHREALTHIAYRELVHTLAARESFRVMIVEREEIAERMRATLQADADQFGLGIEVLFVGLRDIHPPVDVAPAYQAVISAEEQRHAIVYGGHRYRALNLPGAQQTANKKRLESEARGRARVEGAAGEAARFREAADAYHAAPEFLRLRHLLETMEQILPGRPKIVLERGAQRHAPSMLYLPLDPGYSVMPFLDDAAPGPPK